MPRRLSNIGITYLISKPGIFLRPRPVQMGWRTKASAASASARATKKTARIGVCCMVYSVVCCGTVDGIVRPHLHSDHLNRNRWWSKTPRIPYPRRCLRHPARFRRQPPAQSCAPKGKPWRRILEILPAARSKRAKPDFQALQREFRRRTRHPHPAATPWLTKIHSHWTRPRSLPEILDGQTPDNGRANRNPAKGRNGLGRRRAIQRIYAPTRTSQRRSLYPFRASVPRHRWNGSTGKQAHSHA